jgi:tetratricopeptide (TPR) repeat protein
VAGAAVAGCASRAPQQEPGPEGIGPVVARAEAAEAEGDHDAAIAAWREALERTPWNERLRGRLASAHAARAAVARGKGGAAALMRAETDLRAARELVPDDATLRRNLALVLAERAERSADPAEAEHLRQEAAALDPTAVAAAAGLGDVERRLDVAHALVERGQLEAGLLDLEPLWREHPGRQDVGRLYAQTLLRQGVARQEQGDFDGAGAAFDRALEVLRALGACRASPCDDPDVRAAHYDRVVNWLNADRVDVARRALADAEQAGLRFPELRATLGERQ